MDRDHAKLWAMCFKANKPKQKYEDPADLVPVSAPTVPMKPEKEYAVRIARDARSDLARPLASCIKATARSCGTTPGQIELTLTYFLEAVATELSRGETVHISGFGRFAARVFRSGKPGTQPHAIPVFVPHRALRHEVRDRLPVDRIDEMALKRFRKRNAIGAVPKRGHQQTFWSMECRRARVRKEDPFGDDLEHREASG